MTTSVKLLQEKKNFRENAALVSFCALFAQAYSRDSSFGTVTKLYLDDRGIGVQFPAVARDSLL
jgi:hypothetical protein